MLGGGFFGVSASVVLAAAGGVYLYAKHERDAALQAFVDRTGGELQYADASFDGSAVALTDVAVRGRDGTNALSASEIRLYGTDGASAQKAEIRGLVAHLVEVGGHLALPDATVAALGDAGLHLQEITIDRIDLDVRDENGTLRLSGKDLCLAGVSLGGPGGFSATQTNGGELDIVGAEPAVHAQSFTLSDGTLELAGAEVWLRSRTDGLLDVPPVAADAVPTWLGGARASGSQGWWTMSPENWPIPIRAMTITDGHLHAIDRANAVKAAEWDLAVERASVGPTQGDAGARFLPVSIAGTLSGGRVAVEGDIREDGLVRATLTVRNVAATQLNPYFDPSMRQYRVKLASGLLTARVDLTAKESMFAAAMDGSLEGLAFEATGDGAPKALLARRDVPVVVDLDGDLSDEAYLPVNELFRRITDGAFHPAGGAVWRAHDMPSVMPYSPHSSAAIVHEEQGRENPPPVHDEPPAEAPAPAPDPEPAVAKAEPEEKSADKGPDKPSKSTKTPDETMRELRRALDGLRPRRLPGR
jgi:hypothetical protein